MTSIWSIFIQISIRMSVSNHPPTKRLASQPANQPTNQSNIEPINNSTNHTTNQPFNQTTNQPFNRTNPTITQSANQQINPPTLTPAYQYWYSEPNTIRRQTIDEVPNYDARYNRHCT